MDECISGHVFEWNDEKERWICEDCGKVAASTDAHIAPCVGCGAAVDADEVYCQDCL